MNNKSPLISNCIQLLSNMFDDKNKLFSFSTRLENGKYINDFSNPLLLRYTINSYLSIGKYNKTFGEKIFLEEFDFFVKNNVNKITNIGDKGLLLYALSLYQHDEAKQFSQDLCRLSKEKILNCNIQEITWLLLGLTKYYEFVKDDRIIPFASRIFKYIIKFYLNIDSLFPRHDIKNKFRERFISFGGIAYYLKAIYEYSRVFNDNYASVLFKELTKIMMSLQGIDGGWGWFYDNKNPKVLDWFPIYSVHQDAMALLFLFPAIKYFPEEANKSIIKSVNWLFGNNVLKAQMISYKPFFIYRSIKRKYLFNEKFERIIRSYKNVLLNKQDIYPPNTELEINPECRSYHVAWIIYVWADNNNYLDFHNLTEIKDK